MSPWGVMAFFVIKIQKNKIPEFISDKPPHHPILNPSFLLFIQPVLQSRLCAQN